jgi:tetratricopeptide (TPR) repeat protein
MAQNPRRDALLNRELGEAYQVLGSAEITVGDYRAAAQHMSLSADLLERAFQEPDVSLGRDLSFSLSSLARAEWELGNTARSVEALRRQAKALESAIAHSPKAGDRFWASGQLHHAAARLKKAGLADESARLSAKSLELLRGLEIDSIPDTDAANALMLLAAQHRTEERRGEAHRIVQTLVDKGSSLPPRTRAAIHEFRARLFMDEGRFEESMADQATALGIWKDQQEADPANVHVRRSLAEAQESVSQILVKLGRFEAAGAAATEAVSIRRALFSMTPDSEGAQRGLTTSLLSAGDAYLNRDARQAERFYRDAIVLREKLARVQGGRPRALRDLAAGYESLGEALRRQGRRTEAAHFFALSITTTELLPAAERPEPSLERRSKALEDLRSR